MICILGCSAMILFIYLSHSTFISNILRMYGEMRSTLDMNYYEAQINLYSDRVWSIENCSYAPGYTNYLSNLKNYIDLYEQSFNMMITATKNYPNNLEYNSNNRYQFIFSVANNFEITSYNVSLTNLDGISNFIAAAS